MTFSLFLLVFTIGSVVSSLFTEAIKKLYTNVGASYSANIIALMNALFIGFCGTGAMYVLLGVPWTTNNIICQFYIAICIWIGSMVGYDKVLETLKQIHTLKEESICQK